MKLRNGASHLVAGLQKEGIRCVFGLPGTRMVELFEALRQAGLRTVLTTNELGAAFMAGGWARVTGEPGIVITMNGPGFMGALPGIAEAKLDSVPLVHIAGSATDTPAGRRFRQQEIPQTAIATPLVKRIVDADAENDPAVAVRDAIRHAQIAERGPVLLQISPATLEKVTAEVPFHSPSPLANVGQGMVNLRERVSSARRPLFFVGQGVNQHANDFRTVVERLRALVLTAPSARGVLPEDHVFNLGFEPLSGRVAQLNELVDSCDLIVVIGCKLAHSSTAAFELKLPPARLIHVDASREILGANYPASLQIVADAGDAIRSLLDLDSRSEWEKAEIEQWRERLCARATRSEPRLAGTAAGDAKSFFETLRKALPRDSVLVLDSGLHQILARRYYRVLAPCGLLLPTDFQSMGFGIPTAIGAKLALPARPVVALIGDGGLAMTAFELLTAVREGVALVVIVFVDGVLGQIRDQQLHAYGATQAVTIANPDFSLFAASIGARYSLVGGDDLEVVVRSALDHRGVSIVEVPVNDSIGLRRAAALARLREGTRRAAGSRVSRLLSDVLKLSRRISGRRSRL